VEREPENEEAKRELAKAEAGLKKYKDWEQNMCKALFGSKQ